MPVEITGDGFKGLAPRGRIASIGATIAGFSSSDAATGASPKRIRVQTGHVVPEGERGIRRRDGPRRIVRAQVMTNLYALIFRQSDFDGGGFTGPKPA
jgi:hypothetical protein